MRQNQGGDTFEGKKCDGLKFLSWNKSIGLRISDTQGVLGLGVKLINTFKCLMSRTIQKCIGYNNPGMVMHAYIPSIHKGKKEDLEFKVILICKVHRRPAWII